MGRWRTGGSGAPDERAHAAFRAFARWKSVSWGLIEGDLRLAKLSKILNPPR